MAEITKRASMLRKKQLMLLLGVGAFVLLVSVIASFVMAPTKKHDANVEKPKTRQITLGGTATDKESWRVQSGAEFERMQKRLTELESKDKARSADDARKADQKRLEAEEESRKRSLGGPVAPPEPPPGTPPQQGIFSQAGLGNQPVPPPTRPGVGKASEHPSEDGEPQLPRIKTVQITAEDTANAEKEAKAEAVNSSKKFGEQNRNRNAGGNGADGKDRYADDDPMAYNRASGRNAESYLPAGTFIRAALLNGLDAPTGGQAQQNPHPVVLQLVDNAQLPNNFKANLKGCMVTGNGHGDLSAERAYVRLDRLSCVDEEGGAIDVAVRGYVSGEDGKTGLRGRLITKTGQVLANAIFVGAIGGFGDALRQQATTQNNTPIGGQIQSVNNPWQYGLGGGVGKAMDRVAQYYIKLADKLFPVVEVDGGRVVDIVLTRGVSIERK